MRILKSLAREEKGEEIVEFAFAASIFFLVLLGMIEWALAFYAGNIVATAAGQGARYAMVRGSDWTSACASTSSIGCAATTANVKNYILSLPNGGIGLAASDITVNWMTTTAGGSICASNSRGCQVSVKINHSFPLTIPFFATSVPLTSTSIETIQD